MQAANRNFDREGQTEWSFHVDSGPYVALELLLGFGVSSNWH
jgi:hypothetical protein